MRLLFLAVKFAATNTRSILLAMSLALVAIEIAFAQAKAFGSNFEQLVIVQDVDTLFKTEVGKRRQLHSAVR